MIRIDFGLNWSISGCLQMLILKHRFAGLSDKLGIWWQWFWPLLFFHLLTGKL